MECLALEVCLPTDRQRAQWAANIMQQLNGETWRLIGMLADLSDDCLSFLRQFDVKTLNPVDAVEVPGKQSMIPYHALLSHYKHRN